jgi:hypothetical protein
MVSTTVPAPAAATTRHGYRDSVGLRHASFYIGDVFTEPLHVNIGLRVDKQSQDLASTACEPRYDPSPARVRRQRYLIDYGFRPASALLHVTRTARRSVARSPATALSCPTATSPTRTRWPSPTSRTPGTTPTATVWWTRAKSAARPSSRAASTPRIRRR